MGRPESSPARYAVSGKAEDRAGAMADGDPRASQIYQTIGTYLGYGVAHFSAFYDLITCSFSAG